MILRLEFFILIGKVNYYSNLDIEHSTCVLSMYQTLFLLSQVCSLFWLPIHSLNYLFVRSHILSNLTSRANYAFTAWVEATEKATKFVAQLNTTEKVGLVTGSYGSGVLLPCVGTLAAIERLGYHGLCLSDGPAGLSRSDSVSVFASGTWIGHWRGV
jgi:hypothetical protein